MDLLRRFTLVGSFATAVDVAVLLLLSEGFGWPVWLANCVAVLIATFVSWTLHGLTTLPDDPSRRWYRHFGPYLSTAALALLIDVGVIALLDAAFGPTGWFGLLGIKAISLTAAFLVRVARYRNSMFVAVRENQANPLERPEAPGECRLSVVIPAYMEEDRIAATIAAIREATAEVDTNGGVEVIVVDDGSTDRTSAIAHVAGADQVLTHPQNRGKGAAVRTGSLAATGKTVAFTDADLSYSPDQILLLLEGVESGWDIVVGSRRHVDARTVVRAGRLRELGGRVINVLTEYVLLGRYRDTQCGLKAMRSDTAQLVFSHTRIDGFAFDVEIFALVERYRLALLEVPVEVVNSERSTVRVVSDASKLIRDLFRIRSFARVGFYEISEGEGLPLGLHPVSDLDLIFKAYDIRGVVPEQFDPNKARAIGVGFAKFVKGFDPSETPERVLVARDMRPSGEELVEAFSDGVRSQGLDVLDLGLASTDLLYFASGSLDAPGAMFTASHNPAQYNGIKFCRAGARPVGQDSGLTTIRKVADEYLAGSVVDAEVFGNTRSQDLLTAFAEHVHSFVDTSALRPLRIVADTANGMGGLIVPAVFAGLPFDVEVMYGELDGTFPNHPADPIQPENTADLRARVVEAGADVGLAFDGDADRVFLVDENGIGLSGSTTTAIIAAGILDKHPGESVIHNLICSKTVPEVIAERGGTAIRTRVGHSFIKEVMAESGAIFGGEHSAHYYFRDNYRADSGIIAALVVLEQLSVSGQSLSELRAPFERYADSGEINTKVSDPAEMIEKVAAHYADADQDRLDGLTVDFGDWWFNLRASNTEPLLRLNLEASDRESCDARVAEVQAVLAG
ncbi:MAG TPA: glycosyltransferase [Microthrixaceae bacterium]|nr:glycosyltransferase [Microthrixaceae bacterium]